MEMRKYVNTIALVLAFIWLALARPAAAETINCINITSIPTTITTQGVYCLKQHVWAALASGSAITVMGNNITIDCNNHKIGNLAAGPSTNAIGISASNRINVAVRNCGIRGYRVGVSLLDGDYRVEDNIFDQNTQTAILVSGDGSSVRRNEVIDTGASSLAGLTEFYGISVAGDVDVIGNTIGGVVASSGSDGTAYGIRTQDMDAGTVKENRIRNLVSNGSGARRGIWNQNGNRNTVEGNTVIMNGGLLGADVGIRCGDGLILNGASRDNTVLGTGLVGQVLGLVNCTTISGDYVNPL
ncbi:hypothetical protein [Pseudoxanthomonas wuyuanensis]|uniref:Right handed beta helix region n=1 Tax=Pseudoxanthomonas wuyuanensis TaxID=1073196 RepID=A0A286DGF7_9GAMM|nr:hypothetical protein [Pseudoxanthomonas wuyuanensis]SOD57701.1 hypothetical protein SAMN06296416_1162 [Pseudoxanthomonas wuyuanensis]